MMNIKNYIKELSSTIKYSNSIPKNYTMDDIFLVSYPKSGNTWLRFLIANAIKIHYKIDREVNFFSVQDIIPGIRGSGKAITQRGPFGRLDLPRIIKSHFSYNPYYCRVIFLVRDPRDVMASYYHYAKEYQLVSQRITFREFIRHKHYGVKAWLEHTQSWYSSSRPGQIVQLFLYEELMTSPEENLKRLMNLYGVKMKNIELEKAVEMSSKENMKKSAEEHESTFQTQVIKSNFVRKAEVNEGKCLSSLDKKYIEQETRVIAELLGYKY